MYRGLKGEQDDQADLKGLEDGANGNTVAECSLFVGRNNNVVLVGGELHGRSIQIGLPKKKRYVLDGLGHVLDIAEGSLDSAHNKVALGGIVADTDKDLGVLARLDVCVFKSQPSQDQHKSQRNHGLLRKGASGKR